ncbi:iron-sulfur cluster repair di-iron protein [Fulvivirga maritima]|uniref:iron-sulfur cluster repair di-iron protein n=1 Tax=Fulvivirga maritima TaxID=2904247 RepID=UPI001F39EDA3|nr:iron-sulfur cluster repair di-iron protein [Fulvivirga maritima]UII28595.1 iron-sulfur cluster repair di-iron protein [Fulvivirga maritima]
MNQRKINDLVDDNYVYASVLYYFGIKFYDYSEKTLEQACTERGLDVQTVTKKLESVKTREEAPLLLNQYPVDLIITYLQHAHYLFIKQKLPYIAQIIKGFNADHKDYNVIEKDLKFVFPLFVEDFIHHIYEEEDTLFYYIKTLDKFINDGKGNISHVYYLMEKSSLQRYAIEHEEHDDEMLGIRKITDGYHMDEKTPIHVKVIYEELKELEKSLITHARVENEILFPKALMLEKEAKKKFSQKVGFN